MLGELLYTASMTKCTNTVFRWLQIFAFFKMVNNAFITTVLLYRICICNKTSDLPRDNAKDPNLIFLFKAFCWGIKFVTYSSYTLYNDKSEYIEKYQHLQLFIG